MGWFNWMDNLSLWAQMAIGIVLGMGCVAVITLCIMGIRAMLKYLWRLYND